VKPVERRVMERLIDRDVDDERDAFCICALRLRKAGPSSPGDVTRTAPAPDPFAMATRSITGSKRVAATRSPK
jgi:hypothetical protein